MDNKEEKTMKKYSDKLAFLSKSEWQIVPKSYINFERIHMFEEEYWWIEEDETKPVLKDPDGFYLECLDTFIAIMQKEGHAKTLSNRGMELLSLGEKVVYEILYERYACQRHESDPDIFYSYAIGSSFEAGLTIADKWFNNPTNMEEFVDIIIHETTLDFIKDISLTYLHIDSEIERINLISKFDIPLFDLLKWYYKTPNFETYKLKALLAAFYVGVSIVAERIK